MYISALPHWKTVKWHRIFIRVGQPCCSMNNTKPGRPELTGMDQYNVLLPVTLLPFGSNQAHEHQSEKKTPNDRVYVTLKQPKNQRQSNVRFLRRRFPSSHLTAHVELNFKAQLHGSGCELRDIVGQFMDLGFTESLHSVLSLRIQKSSQ